MASAFFFCLLGITTEGKHDLITPEDEVLNQNKRDATSVTSPFCKVYVHSAVGAVAAGVGVAVGATAALLTTHTPGIVISESNLIRL
jgi:hypothetical protein